MNCPECLRLVFVTQKRCACGAVLPTPKVEAKPERKDGPAPVLRREVAEKESEVNAFVSLHRTKNPKATVREACIEFMKERGLLNKLPKHLRVAAEVPSTQDFDDAMDDYRMNQAEDAA